MIPKTQQHCGSDNPCNSCRTFDSGFNRIHTKGKRINNLGRITNAALNAVLLQIFHTTDGKVVAINFGKDGYMVTIVPGKETTCVYNGKSLKSIVG